MAIRQPILRPAVIVGGINPTDQTCIVQFSDRSDGEDNRKRVTLPHPMASSGWGILATPTTGTRVMINMQQNELPHIVSTVPISQFSSDFNKSSNVIDISVDQPGYPILAEGSMALQSASGSNICLENDGRILFDVNDIELEYSPRFNALSESYTSLYTNTNSHRQISGPIKRDLRERPESVETLFDKLLDVDTDTVLSKIGRNPLLPAEPLTVNLNSSNEILRNPALVENRTMVYEFTRSAMVQDHAKEVERLQGAEGPAFLSQNSRRDLARSDILNLGLHLPNNLIERVEGTVVDYYGNILDINRSKIEFSELINSEQMKNADKRMEIEAALLRRSIKYHFEINARKEGLAETTTDVLDGVNADDESSNIGYSHSRFSMDIDGEGFVKLNIPSTSNVGNIPLLSRYSNAFDKEAVVDRGEDKRNDGTYRNNPRVDVLHMAFGNTEGLGIDVPPEYIPDNIISEGAPFKYRTAYHDVLNIVTDVRSEDGPAAPLLTALDNTIDLGEGTASPNAGGRSMHANLDGSLELNIGRDVSDFKSILVDTAGGIVSSLGKDKNGNSITTQTDGDVQIQVGGSSVRGEEAATTNNFTMFVRAGDGQFHKIEMNENGVFITSAPNTNLVLESNKNLVLSAKGQTLLGGESIQVYGSFANNGDTISGERLFLRNGKEVK